MSVFIHKCLKDLQFTETRTHSRLTCCKSINITVDDWCDLLITAALAETQRNFYQIFIDSVCEMVHRISTWWCFSLSDTFFLPQQNKAVRSDLLLPATGKHLPISHSREQSLEFDHSQIPQEEFLPSAGLEDDQIRFSWS